MPFSVIVDEFSWDEKSADKAIRLQDGVSIFVIVEIAIIKGKDNGLGGEGFVVGDGAGERVEVDRGMAIVGQILHLGLECFWRYRKVRSVNIGIFWWMADVVVHENGYGDGEGTAVLRCGQRW